MYQASSSTVSSYMHIHINVLAKAVLYNFNHDDVHWVRELYLSTKCQCCGSEICKNKIGEGEE